MPRAAVALCAGRLDLLLDVVVRSDEMDARVQLLRRGELGTTEGDEPPAMVGACLLGVARVGVNPHVGGAHDVRERAWS